MDRGAFPVHAIWGFRRIPCPQAVRNRIGSTWGGGGGGAATHK